MIRYLAATGFAALLATDALAQTASPRAARPPTAAPANLSSPLTVEQAVARALAASPSTGAAAQSVLAARAARLQAGVLPTDQLEVDVENPVSTNGAFRDTELTVALARTFERGGKRQARIAVAEREIAVAEANALVRRLELARSVERAFVDALIADARIVAAASQLEIERLLSAEAERRVRGYKDPLFVRTRAGARVAEATVNLTRAQMVRDGAYAALASLIGADAASLRLDEDGFLRPSAIDARRFAVADLALASAEIERADALIALERARAVPDYTIRGGVKVRRDTKDLGVVGGIAFPLGKGRANRGNVERALADRERVRLEAEALRRERIRQIAALRAQAEASRAEARAIETEVLPRLQRALNEVREGYNRGGFSFADIQDQARALFEARGRLVEALVRHHETRVELDRLTGRFATLEIK